MLYNNDSLSRLEHKKYNHYNECLKRYQSTDHRKILSDLFKQKIGTNLCLINPRTYNEKLQWMKLFWRDKRATRCTDKYAVKEYIKELSLSELVIETIAVFNQVEDIDFCVFPTQYVLKATHASGFNLFVSDATTINTQRLKDVINKILKLPYYAAKLEWNYKNVKPRIIMEPLLTISNSRALDFKFYCFHGEVLFVEIMTACEWSYLFEPKELIVDKNFNRLDFSYSFENKLNINKPADFDKMVEIATRLSLGFPHVRIDLLNPKDGIIKFGEFTFFPSAGLGSFSSPEIDLAFGNKLNLSLIKDENRIHFSER